MTSSVTYRFLITAGGTGGHIFPALALANYLRTQYAARILFVGTNKRMEKQWVPQAGFDYYGLPVRGLIRGVIWRNISFVVQMLLSMFLAYRVLRRFDPHVVIGTGGYVTVPCVWVATWLGIPTLIHESNAVAGLAHRWLGRRVDRVCVSYPSAGRIFDTKRVLHTGTPLREELYTLLTRAEAKKQLKLNINLPTLLIMGGSLGAQLLNEAVLAHQRAIQDNQVQLLWICGERYYKSCAAAWGANQEGIDQKNIDQKNIKSWGQLLGFCENIPLAYAAADVVIARGGALSIAELLCVKRPAILVPSPNVVARHQHQNVAPLVANGAALSVEDVDVVEKLIPMALDLLQDPVQQEKMTEAMQAMDARRRPTTVIAEELIRIAG